LYPVAGLSGTNGVLDEPPPLPEPPPVEKPPAFG
jgi:hypothetical protein